MSFDEAIPDSKPAPTGFVADVLSAARALIAQPIVVRVMDGPAVGSAA